MRFHKQFFALLFALIILLFSHVCSAKSAGPAQDFTRIQKGRVSGMWSQALSPYIVEGDIQLLYGDTLEIQPGAEVLFKEGVRFEIYGTLIARGHRTAPIVMRPELDDRTWRGIRFDAPSGRDPRQSYLSHAVFKQGNSPSGQAIHSAAVSILHHRLDELTHCHFHGWYIGVTSFMGSSLKNISNNSFSHIIGPRAVAKTAHLDGSDRITVMNNEFRDLAQTAIHIAHNERLRHIYLEGNRFVRVGGGIGREHSATAPIMIQHNHPKAQIVFSGNTVIDSGSRFALSGGLACVTNGTLESANNLFENNFGRLGAALNVTARRFYSHGDTFINNSTSLEFEGDGKGGAVHFYPQGKPASLFVDASRFEGNQSRTRGGAVYLDMLNPMDSVAIQSTVFLNNQAPRGAALYAHLTGELDQYLMVGNRFLDTLSHTTHSLIHFDLPLTDLSHQRLQRFHSINNHMESGGAHRVNALIKYSGRDFPHQLLFREDTVKHIKADNDFPHYLVVFEQPDAIIDNPADAFYNQLSLTVESSHYENIQAGLFRFHTWGRIHEMKAMNSGFHQIRGAGGLGGVFHFDIKRGQLSDGTQSFRFSGNEIHHIDLDGGKGAFLFLNTHDLQSFMFTQNTLYDVKAGGDGGALYLSLQGVQSVHLDSLLVDSLESGGSGGFLHLDAKHVDAFRLLNADFTNVRASNDGGALYLRSPVLAEFQMQDVKVSGGKARNGNGGFLGLLTNDLSKASISRSRVEYTRAAHQGGAFYMGSSIIRELQLQELFLENLVSGTEGGAIYLESDSLLGQLHLRQSRLGKLSAGGHGGGVYIKGQVLHSMMLDSLHVEDAYTQTQGGFLYAKAGLIGDFQLVNSYFSGLFARKEGGAIHVTTDEMTNLEMQRLNVASVGSHEADGGFFFLQAQKANRLAWNHNVFSDLTAKGSGGGLYIQLPEWSKMIFANASVEKAHAEGDGGFLFLLTNQVGNLQFSDSQFKASSAGKRGGALFISGVRAAQMHGVLLCSNESVAEGGGLYANGFERIEVSHSVFSNQRSGSMGGAIFVSGNQDTGSLRLENSTLTRNRAQRGGGVYADSLQAFHAGRYSWVNPPGMGNHFLGNVASQSGSAVHVRHAASFQVLDNHFVGNHVGSDRAEAMGGSLAIEDEPHTNWLVSYNQFTGNTSNNYGASIALDLRANHPGTAKHIANNLFTHEHAVFRGGAIHIYSSAGDSQWPGDVDRLMIRDNVFFQNASDLGGAIFSGCPLVVKRNLFRENRLVRNPNTPASLGPAIYLFRQGVQSRIYNSVFDGHINGRLEDGTIHFDNRSVQSMIDSVSVVNSTFLHHESANRAIHVRTAPDSFQGFGVLNSIFMNPPVKENPGDLFTSAESEAKSARYFSEHVLVNYSATAYVSIPGTGNISDPVQFDHGRCEVRSYVPRNDEIVIHAGHPGREFHDRHRHHGYGSLRNTMGITGGPHNPDLESRILCEFLDPGMGMVLDYEQSCNDFLMEVHPAGAWNHFTWYLPDSVVVTTKGQWVHAFDSTAGDTLHIQVIARDTTGIEKNFGHASGYLVKRSLLALEWLDERRLDEVPWSYSFGAFSEGAELSGSFHWSLDDLNGLSASMTQEEPGFARVEINRLGFPFAGERSFVLRYETDVCGGLAESREILISTGEVQSPQPAFIQPTNTQVEVDPEELLVIHFSPGIMAEFHSSYVAIDEAWIGVEPRLRDLVRLLNVRTQDEILLRLDSYDHTDGTLLRLAVADAAALSLPDQHQLQVLGKNIVSADFKIPLQQDASIAFSFFDDPSNQAQRDLLVTGPILYPNPVRNQLNIDLGVAGTHYGQVYAYDGSSVISFMIKDSCFHQLDVSHLPVGWYYLVLHHLATGNRAGVSFIKSY